MINDKIHLSKAAKLSKKPGPLQKTMQSGTFSPTLGLMKFRLFQTYQAKRST